MKSWIDMTLVPFLAYLYVRFLRATMRLAWDGREILERLRREHGSYILAFWHGRFVMMPYVYPGGRMSILVSRHRDAQRLGRLLRHFGFEVVVGSSTRGGAAGLRAMLRAVREGSDLAVAIDGPKGPRRVAKPGTVAAAKLTGLPVVPVTFSTSAGRRLGSWDRTLLPRPFSRGLFLYGEPIVVPRDADDAEQERLRLRLESCLGALTDEADRRSGFPAEAPAGDGA